MGGIVKRYTFQNKGNSYKRRCDLCHQARQSLYHAQFEENGPFYWLCPLNCFQNAQKNYTEKKDKGIMPTIEHDTVDDMPEQVITSNEDNILRE